MFEIYILIAVIVGVNLYTQYKVGRGVLSPT